MKPPPTAFCKRCGCPMPRNIKSPLFKHSGGAGGIVMRPSNFGPCKVRRCISGHVKRRGAK